MITREAKKRREAAEAFAQGGRPEQAEREKAEGEILAAYLPKQLDDDELNRDRRPGRRGGEGGRCRGAACHGPVMKIVNPKVAGLAEGGRVAAVVKKLLAG